MIMVTNITFPYEQIADFCQRNHIYKLSLFGSAITGEFRDSSDIDLLVEFESGSHTDLIRFAEMQDELSKLLDRPVDLNTAHSLSRHFRQQVIEQARVIYEQKG